MNARDTDSLGGDFYVSSQTSKDGGYGHVTTSFHSRRKNGLCNSKSSYNIKDDAFLITLSLDRKHPGSMVVVGSFDNIYLSSLRRNKSENLIYKSSIVERRQSFTNKTQRGLAKKIASGSFKINSSSSSASKHDRVDKKKHQDEPKSKSGSNSSLPKPAVLPFKMPVIVIDNYDGDEKTSDSNTDAEPYARDVDQEQQAEPSEGKDPTVSGSVDVETTSESVNCMENTMTSSQVVTVVKSEIVEQRIGVRTRTSSKKSLRESLRLRLKISNLQKSNSDEARVNGDTAEHPKQTGGVSLAKTRTANTLSSLFRFKKFSASLKSMSSKRDSSPEEPNRRPKSCKPAEKRHPQAKLIDCKRVQQSSTASSTESLEEAINTNKPCSKSSAKPVSLIELKNNISATKSSLTSSSSSSSEQHPFNFRKELAYFSSFLTSRSSISTTSSSSQSQVFVFPALIDTP